MTTKPLPSPDAALAVLDANRQKIQNAGATRAYVGWHFEANWITHQRAIVVWTPAANVEAVQKALPAQLDGIPLDVRSDPRPKKKSATGGVETLSFTPPSIYREEYSIANFPHQIDFGPTAGLAEMTVMKKGKSHVDYVAPSGVNLNALTASMTLTLHVSPEQGWAQLKPFLESKFDDLVVGMYEFTAPHIEKSVLAARSPATKLTLTLDSPPEGQSKREQTVEKTHDDLAEHFKSRLSFAWALSGYGTKAPAMAFPTSYHIKVAVKDSRKFWLSSGNWNSSNQPELDPADEDALAKASKSNDRDWHVICDCPELARIFQAYLLTDFQTAASNAEKGLLMAAAATPRMEIIQPSPAQLPTIARAPKTFFKAKTISGTIKIKPLLTPDDYRQPILELIKQTKSRFYMQTQYIHTVDDNNDTRRPSHMSLIDAVVELIKTERVDVKLIASEWQSKSWLEKLQDAGLDAANYVKIQPKVHNKGIVVDSSIVVVSSQNWSADGTGENRDAGLIIYDPDAAKYFEAIFVHDWENMAAKRAYGS